MSSLFVKICGITSEADALLAVGLGATAVGFIFAPSPRQITPATAGDIAKRLPSEVVTVGVFRDEVPSRVVEIVNQAGLGGAQLHGHETAEASRYVAERVGLTIKAFPAGDPAIGRFREFDAHYLMIDGASPGAGKVFDWRLGEGVVDPSRLIVSGGLRPDNVADAIEHLRPFGVDVATGVESAPGRKDPQKVRDFVVNAVRAADALAALHGDHESDDDAPGGAPYDWMQG
jgi:phosphoribosylanthranilate isomerase